MATYDVEVTVTDPILQPVTVTVSEPGGTGESTLTIFEKAADTTNSAPYTFVWDTETADPQGWGAIGSGNLVCPATGLYTIGGKTVTSGSIGLCTVETRVNGTAIDIITPNTTKYQTVYLTIGDIITMVWINTSEANRTVTHAAIYIGRIA